MLLFSTGGTFHAKVTGHAILGPMSRIPHVRHETGPNTCSTCKFMCPEGTRSSMCPTRARNVSQFQDTCPIEKDPLWIKNAIFKPIISCLWLFVVGFM